jgi:hypothetical protein
MSTPINDGRIVLRWLVVGIATVLFMPSPSTAASFTSGVLSFLSPTQSIWGPGSSSAAFSSSGFLLGNSVTGVSYSSSASTGTVSSSVTGRLGASYADNVHLSSSSDVLIGLDFLGGASSFQSDLGANVRVAGHLLDVINNFTIFDQDYGLNINSAFVSETPATATGSDDFTPAAVSLDLPTGGVGLSGTAGVALDIQQDATLQTLGLDGTLLARNVPTGTTVSVPFDIDMLAGEILHLNLGLPGLWEFRFLDLGLRGDYTSLFSAEFNPFVGGGYGVFCGDPFDPNDNFLCIDEGGVKTDELIGVDLYRSPRIALNYNRISDAGGFNVFVAPEPGTLWLMLVAAGALYRVRRRRSPSPTKCGGGDGASDE